MIDFLSFGISSDRLNLLISDTSYFKEMVNFGFSEYFKFHIIYDNISCIIVMIMSIPLIGILGLLFIPNTKIKIIREFAFVISLITFFLSLKLWINFNPMYGLQLFDYFLLSEGMAIFFGVDGVSLFLIILTTFLIPLCILSSWDNIFKEVKLYYILFLLLEFFLIGVFSVLDLLMFYIMYEAVLIPMFLIVGIYGSRERRIRAAYQLFIYTFVGSVLMLLCILILYSNFDTTNFLVLKQLCKFLTIEQEKILFLGFFASLAVKIPMVPFHIWLPEAHSEAPTAGSVILAGILLKMGGYGFFRFSIPLFPQATIYFTPFIYTLSILAVIYISLTTLRQIDMKRLIAYSSVAHMGFVTIGLFSLTLEGTMGAIYLMLSHGIVSSALFLCVGVLYDRYKTRLIKYYGGTTITMPLFTIIFWIFIMANIGFPGTSSFIAEFTALIGAFKSNSTIAFLATTGIIFGAAYSIWLYNRIAGGNIKIIFFKGFKDLTRREFFVFAPCVFLTIWMGIYPSIFTDLISFSIIENIDLVYKL